MVGGDGGGGLDVTLRRSRPCVTACEGCVCVCVCGPAGCGEGEWQMFGVFLEAVTQERGLPVCPLMGHMAGQCRLCALCAPKRIMSHILQQYAAQSLCSRDLSASHSWLICYI